MSMREVVIPREVVMHMLVSQRAEVDATLSGLCVLGDLTRQDRVDDPDEERAGATYFTGTDVVFDIVSAIAKDGYNGLVVNRAKLNTYVEGLNNG